jgi:hypothetical protein
LENHDIGGGVGGEDDGVAGGAAARFGVCGIVLVLNCMLMLLARQWQVMAEGEQA